MRERTALPTALVMSFLMLIASCGGATDEESSNAPPFDLSKYQPLFRCVGQDGSNQPCSRGRIDFPCATCDVPFSTTFDPNTGKFGKINPNTWSLLAADLKVGEYDIMLDSHYYDQLPDDVRSKAFVYDFGTGRLVPTSTPDVPTVRFRIRRIPFIN